MSLAERSYSETILTVQTFSDSVNTLLKSVFLSGAEDMATSPSPLSRAEQKQVTRQKLLDATIDLIAEQGLSGVTLGKVAQRTGLSRGISNYHFETKEQLMLEVLRMLYQEHERAWRSAVADVDESPVRRLHILIKTLLTPPIADHRKVAVWMAFWGVAPQRETYLEICASIDREYEAEVAGVLRQLSADEESINGMSLKDISVTLTSMIDGFWLNYLISPGCLEPENAVKACLAFLSSFFPEFKSLPSGD